MTRTSEEVGSVVRLWTKRVRRGPMDPQETLTLSVDSGIEDDANRSRGKRQVTLMEEELWEKAEAHLGETLDPALRRANVMVKGVSLERRGGGILEIGPCRLRVWGENPPCRLMDDAHPGLQEALRPDWRAGVYAQILEGGAVSVGDPVRWQE